MEVVFLGIHDIGFRIYEWLCQRERVDVLALLTEADQPDVIEQQTPDLVVSLGLDHLVPQESLEIPPDGALNLHPSLVHRRKPSA